MQCRLSAECSAAALYFLMATRAHCITHWHTRIQKIPSRKCHKFVARWTEEKNETVRAAGIRKVAGANCFTLDFAAHWLISFLFPSRLVNSAHLNRLDGKRWPRAKRITSRVLRTLPDGISSKVSDLRLLYAASGVHFLLQTLIQTEKKLS